MRLTSVEWIEIALAVENKRDAVESGMYDDFVGEINHAGSDTHEWAEHLNDILSALGEKVSSGVVPKNFKPALSKDDWQEIYYALDDNELQAKLGPDARKMTEAR